MSVGDSKFLVQTKIRLGRANLKLRDRFLEHLGQSVGEFCQQIGADGVDWVTLKERLGEEGWKTSIVFTKHMHEAYQAQDNGFAAIPWKLITIALSPVRRATDASEDQLQWLDRLIEEAQRHCALLEKMQKNCVIPSANRSSRV